MTPLPDGYRVVAVPRERKPELLAVDHLAFAYEPDAATSEIVPDQLEWDRTVAVERPDGTLAAVHASYDFDLPVPGGEVACAGLTWVGVRPDERRRGLLTAMMDAHFTRSLERGEPVSALTAAEMAIYGRFGYGCASDDVRLKVPRGARLRDVPGSDALTVRIATADPDEHTELVHALHTAAGAGRPGWVLRSSDALRRGRVVDPPAWRDGGEPLRIVTVHDEAGEPRAYALLRRKETWAETGARYPVMVREAVAADAAAAHRLWSFVLDMDLTHEVSVRGLAPDDALLSLLLDSRSAVPQIGDNVWVRLLDVPRALTARRYAAPVDVVLKVTDDRLPANARRWRLTTGEADGAGLAAEVTPSDDEPDLRLDVRELGGAYLGGRSLAAYARAGLVTELTPGALLRTATAFSWPLAPVCSWVF
ncbi:GNAT family N-acetyltransferase [Cellulomonas sp. DKR-3]|uniref:GNAT family N-acetyltransferase n=1 Tax=Cellulomonas fulva TaxID=2835530 RepID=A0ABS5U2M5_9CELL|nr:GNAT family N-acetyltransferase [Cellulomonas fulva]MBT0995648.1 GNAT family N-acetyltransferase [Cellulomonas fulva]